MTGISVNTGSSAAAGGRAGLRLAGEEGFRHGCSLIIKGNNRDLLLEEARHLAASLNCLEDDPAMRPCGRCLHCKAMAAGTFPYWFLLEPEGAASLIRISQIRDLQKKLMTKAGGGRVRVAVFRDAHRMREESQNCLLKTLEEPPGYTLLLLLTDRPRDLLPTVRSRCRVLDSGDDKPLPERTELDLVLDVVGDIRKRGYAGVLDKAAFVDGSRRKRLPAFFGAMEFLLRGAMVESLCSPERAAEGGRTPELAGGPRPELFASGENCVAALAQVWRAAYLAERNVNALLILENLFLQIKRLDIRAEEGGTNI